MTDFLRLDERVAVVTAVGREIGAGVAWRFHMAGARIAVF